MYRTDKQFMKNPATAYCRIYVGNLPKAIIADDLESKFSVHGKILGLVINTGFAFIQYDLEEEAHAAIKAENGTTLLGRKLIVRQAFAGKDAASSQQSQPQQIKVEPVQVELPKAPSRPVGFESEVKGDIKIKFEPPGDKDQDLQDEDMDAAPIIRPPPQKPNEDRGRQGRGGGRGGGRTKSRDRFDHPRDLPVRDKYPDRGPAYYGGGRGDYIDNYGPAHGAPPPEILPPPPDRNDCEIIVVSRALTEYAEFIESKLKQLGLIVDLLFPNEDVPIGRVLANISSRGCLFAVLVMPQNEEHRSMTLNILHGIPQEHRNMPVDDALLLVSRNFEAYMRGETLDPVDPNKMNLADRHSQPIQMLLNLLAENRMLTSAQYDRLIKYLQDRRELQYEHERAEGVAPEPADDSSNKQNELQSRILDILNKTSETPIPMSITAPEPAPKEGPTPLLRDPSVQKALDSLLSGEMFKSMSGGM